MSGSKPAKPRLKDFPEFDSIVRYTFVESSEGNGHIPTSNGQWVKRSALAAAAEEMTKRLLETGATPSNQALKNAQDHGYHLGQRAMRETMEVSMIEIRRALNAQPALKPVEMAGEITRQLDEKRKSKYPISHGTHILQYADEVFVWYDEAGLMGGCEYALHSAQQRLKLHSESLEPKSPEDAKSLYKIQRYAHLTTGRVVEDDIGEFVLFRQVEAWLKTFIPSDMERAAVKVRPKGGYPFVIESDPQITQYNDDVFVWHIAGSPRGATSSLRSARIELKRYNQRHDNPHTRITIEPGYERLGQVLQAAHDQSALGKGKERHANNLPFHEQRMQQISEMLNSPHGMSYQACKKITEGLQMEQPDRQVKELLGAIVYIAGIIIFLQGKSSDPHSLLFPRQSIAPSDKPKWQCSQCGSPDPELHRAGCITQRDF